MKKTPSPQELSKEWTKEFIEFNEGAPIAPPRGLSESIISRVHRDLHPLFWAVFLKLSLIHAVVGTITLLFCPQFGFGVTSGMGLMELFMRFGDQACMVGCGAVYMGGSFLVASLALRAEEVRVIRKQKLLQVTTLAFLSVGIFICSGAPMIAGLGLFWLIGSVLGGVGTLELGWMLRTRFLAKNF